MASLKWAVEEMVDRDESTTRQPGPTRRFTAVSLVALQSLWSLVLTFACLSDSTNLRPNEWYYWAAFSFLVCGLTGLVVATAILASRLQASPFLIYWVLTTGVAMTYFISHFVSTSGVPVAIDAVYLVSPLFLLPPVVIAILHWRTGLFGIALPAILLILLTTAIAIHIATDPAESVMIYDEHHRPELELFMPGSATYYLRPLSVALTMIAWSVANTWPLFRLHRNHRIAQE